MSDELLQSKYEELKSKYERLFHKGQKMRQAQIDYFKSRGGLAFNKAQALARDFDALVLSEVEERKNPQQKLL